MKAIGVLILIGALACNAAFASKECDWAMQVHIDESYRIGTRNQLIAQIQRTIEGEQNHLNKELMPVFEAVTRTVSVYGKKEQTARDSQLAVKQAIVFVQETIISDRAVRRLLERLTPQLKTSPGRSLSQQMRDALAAGRMDRSARIKLEQLANAVEFVERSQVDFQASEKQLFEAYLNGTGSLVDDLFQTLNQLNERLTADINELENGHLQDQARANDLAKQISDAQNRILVGLTQIAAYQRDNAASAAHMRQWEPSNYCPRPGRLNERPGVT